MTKFYKYRKSVSERVLFVVGLSTAVAIAVLAAIGIFILMFPTLNQIMP